MNFSVEEENLICIFFKQMKYILPSSIILEVK